MSFDKSDFIISSSCPYFGRTRSFWEFDKPKKNADRITYTRSSSNFGGHIWCDVHGKFVSKVNNNQSGATTSTYSFTAQTDGWFYWEVGKYDANASVTISNATVVIS